MFGRGLAMILMMASWGCGAEQQGAEIDRAEQQGAEIDRAALMDPASSQMNEQAPDEYKAQFVTTKGTFVVQVTRAWAPLGADRFYNLVKRGYYHGCAVFRVLPGFVVQFGISGDPEIAAKWAGHPQLNPDYKDATLQDEPVIQSNTRGTLTYAKSSMPNSRTTQVFVNLGDNARSLDGKGFAPFGKVVEGLEVVEGLYSGYGEGVSRRQGEIAQRGNEYLKEKFPKLDYIEQARIVD